MKMRTAILAGAAVLAVVPAIDAARALGFTNFYAAVNAAGSVLKSSGVTGVVKTSTGTYEVTFSREVGGCVFIATPRTNAAAFVGTTGKAGDANVVVVTLYGSNAVKKDFGFSLLVECNL